MKRAEKTPLSGVTKWRVRYSDQCVFENTIVGGICDGFVYSLEAWVPDDHDDEYGLQGRRRGYVDAQLNGFSSPSVDVCPGGGAGEQYSTRREYGTSRDNVAVGDTAGVEMRDNPSGGRLNELRNQSETKKADYASREAPVAPSVPPNTLSYTVGCPYFTVFVTRG